MSTLTAGVHHTHCHDDDDFYDNEDDDGGNASFCILYWPVVYFVFAFWCILYFCVFLEHPRGDDTNGSQSEILGESLYIVYWPVVYFVFVF